MRDNNTPKRRKNQGVKIRRADGRIVGEIVNGVFSKSIDASKHFLRVPPAIANDLDVLAQAKERGARVCEITDRETGTTYRATIEKIWRRGFHVERGHGAQIALALSEWARDGEPTADQAKLF